MKNAVFWVVMPCGCFKNLNFGRICFLSQQGGKQLFVTAYVPTSLILSILMMEAMRSSETSVLARGAT
jgi:hypothetical protein